MNLRRRRLTLIRLGWAVFALGVLGAAWHLFVLDATYHAVRSSPQGQATGPANAPVVIVEFMDYLCAPCQSLAPVMAAVARAHPEVRIVYRTIPTHGVGSITDALYAMAAGEQGHFMDMHAALLAHNGPVTDAELPGLCAQAQVDCAKLKAGMQDKALMNEIINTRHAAQVLGVRNAPTFLVNRTLYTATHGLPTAQSFDHAIALAQGSAQGQAK